MAARYLESAIDCGPPHNPQTYCRACATPDPACDPAIDSTEFVAQAQIEAPTPRDIEADRCCFA